MSKRVIQGLFVVWLALQPASMWTLLGVLGSDHTLRLAMTDGGIDLVLSHLEPAELHHAHRHNAVDRLLASHDDVAGEDRHVIRRAPGEPSIVAREAVPAPPAWWCDGYVLVANHPVRLASPSAALARDVGEPGTLPLRL